MACHCTTSFLVKNAWYVYTAISRYPIFFPTSLCSINHILECCLAAMKIVEYLNLRGMPLLDRNKPSKSSQNTHYNATSVANLSIKICASLSHSSKPHYIGH